MSYKNVIDANQILAELFGTGEDEECINDLVRASDLAANISLDLGCRLPNDAEDFDDHLREALVSFHPDKVNGISQWMRSKISRMEIDLRIHGE
jgi:hypothetical protein